MRSYYSILGLPESATASEIKSAFKALAVKYHPDKNPDNPLMEELFKEVNQAYQVLSNPYDKARYDLQLQFGNQQEIFHSAPTPEPPSYQNDYQTRRPKYTERKINWRENWIATGYAFGFTFIVASVIMIGIGIKEYYDSVKLEELLANRRAIFTQVKTDHKKGKLAAAFVALDELGTFMKGEDDMKAFKTKAIEALVFNAQHELNLENFHQAIFYFELIEQFAPRNPLPLQERLAYAYREAGLTGKALKKLTELLILDYDKINLYLAKAEIYRDDLMNTEESIRYFELASDMAIRQYEAVYGKAYPLMMTGKSVPKAHYDIYTGLAQQYLLNKEYERALKSTAWNINMWPDSLANYRTAIEANMALGKQSLACETVAIARGLGLNQDFDLICR